MECIYFEIRSNYKNYIIHINQITMITRDQMGRADAALILGITLT